MLLYTLQSTRGYFELHITFTNEQSLIGFFLLFLFIYLLSRARCHDEKIRFVTLLVESGDLVTVSAGFCTFGNIYNGILQVGHSGCVCNLHLIW